jgi:SAM-dependent methyltransferase
VPRDLRLRSAKDLDEVADANLLLAHQVQQPKASRVTESLKETGQIDLSFSSHVLCIRIDECVRKRYIHLDEYVRGENMAQVLDAVRSKYGAVAESTLSSNDAGVKAVAEAFGYSAEELTSIPAEANMGLSCGNPTATAHLRPGEVVVDLGSGGGLDVFLAAKMVGPEGRAIGIDMTAAMIERARANATAGGYTNVEFHQSTIENIPLPDASVDCVISNCVLNLAPDKAAVFREIARVLKPGGRLAVSDIALKGELPEAIARSMAAYVGCIGGAIRIEDYRAGLLAAGFEHVEIVDSGADLNAYAKVENQSGCCSPAMAEDSCCSPSPASDDATLHEELSDLLSKYDVNAAAASVKVYAIKPGTESRNKAAAPWCAPGCCS